MPELDKEEKDPLRQRLSGSFFCWSNEMNEEEKKYLITGGHTEFEDDLQMFANKVGIVVGLESNKSTDLTAEVAYEEIKKLFKKLKKKKKKADLTSEVQVADGWDREELYCPNCEEDTEHFVRCSEYERDSSYDNFICTKCDWEYFGITGKYQPPGTGVG